MAAVAEESAFEVVGQDAVALTAGAASIEDILHTMEEFWGDDGRVASFVAFALVDDVAEVVGVGEHLVQRAVGDGLAAAS
ncbi:hypothetical protein AB0H71_16490 [Nocardia sp. NPDC050697]|uniref:hypothetical protein n=1 Tax=Nocardia sp. NPDC050697 TaxID=3155158 RepID=UPI0034011756